MAYYSEARPLPILHTFSDTVLANSPPRTGAVRGAGLGFGAFDAANVIDVAMKAASQAEELRHERLRQRELAGWTTTAQIAERVAKVSKEVNIHRMRNQQQQHQQPGRCDL